MSVNVQFWHIGAVSGFVGGFFTSGLLGGVFGFVGGAIGWWILGKILGLVGIKSATT